MDEGTIIVVLFLMAIVAFTSRQHHRFMHHFYKEQHNNLVDRYTELCRKYSKLEQEQKETKKS